MEILAGSTGFVGGNIAAQHAFDGLYHSRNIADAFGAQPDLLVYAGVPSEMFLANANPAADLAVCKNAAENIRKIAPKRLALVSSIAVLDSTVGVDEGYAVNTANLKPYGANRYALEQLARGIVPDCHVVRLPALFGRGLRKNFIYDIISFVPAMLNKAKYDELSAKEPLIGERYRLADSGFYRLTENSAELKAAFERAGFSALNFTDSRSVFQFYNLSHLWKHIRFAVSHNIPLLHLATEPLEAGVVYQYLTGGQFTNETANPLRYDFRTKYADIAGGSGGYLFDKDVVLGEMKMFAEGEK